MIYTPDPIQIQQNLVWSGSSPMLISTVVENHWLKGCDDRAHVHLQPVSFFPLFLRRKLYKLRVVSLRALTQARHCFSRFVASRHSGKGTKEEAHLHNSKLCRLSNVSPNDDQRRNSRNAGRNHKGHKKLLTNIFRHCRVENIADASFWIGTLFSH